MNEATRMVLSGIAGVLLGGFFFGGLLWTVKKGISSSKPVLLFAGSFIIRNVAALAGFYFVSDNDWKRILSCLAGFIIAKYIINRFSRETPEKYNHTGSKAQKCI